MSKKVACGGGVKSPNHWIEYYREKVYAAKMAAGIIIQKENSSENRIRVGKIRAEIDSKFEELSIVLMVKNEKKIPLIEFKLRILLVILAKIGHYVNDGHGSPLHLYEENSWDKWLWGPHCEFCQTLTKEIVFLKKKFSYLQLVSGEILNVSRGI